MIASELKKSTELEPIPLSALPDRPLVSILVANYNYEKYIAQTIESALAQTYSHFELIVCDDGSTDNSIQVIEACARNDERIRLIRKSNGGHGSALNAAFDESRGEILCLLDSDDLFTPGKVQQVVDCCRENPDSGFLIHRVIRINDKGRRQGVWPMSDALPEGWWGAALLGEGGVLAYLPPTSGISLRRELAEALFPVPAEKPLGICPDQVIMRLAPFLSPIAAIAAPLAVYRLHRANSYGTPRVTAAFLEREISVCQSLWEAQRAFLLQRSASLASRLEPVDTSSYLFYLRYLHARLSHDPAVGRRHSEYMANLRKQPGARYVRFWAASLHLPLFLFDYAINLMSRQSAIKQVMALLKGVV
jgi:glycosyltransferase involved in cell wall biosynthesis